MLFRSRGKFMWVELDRPEVLVAHLGMSGQLLIKKSSEPAEKHLRVRIDLGSFELRFIDQRTFGWLSVESTIDGIPQCASHIALDPFDEAFSVNETITRFLSRRTEIKRALLDQEIMSGVGNIYADEALWYARIHPEAIACELTSTQILNVVTAAQKVMQRALKAGGTSFDELYINVNGESGYFERSLAVYGREGEPCRRCGGEISRIAFANRSSRFCPACQTR